MKNIAFFASWTREWWWSWVRNVLETNLWNIREKIKVIISNYPNGWVSKVANEFNIPLEIINNFPKRWENGEFTKEDEQKIIHMYENIIKKYDLDWIFLSGWLKVVFWVKENMCVNIHPGPVCPPYGWVWMYWKKVHEEVFKNYQAGKIQETCISFHYVNSEIDKGKIIIQIPISLRWITSVEQIEEIVKREEHKWQPIVYDKIIKWEI